MCDRLSMQVGNEVLNCVLTSLYESYMSTFIRSKDGGNNEETYSPSFQFNQHSFCSVQQWTYHPSPENFQEKTPSNIPQETSGAFCYQTPIFKQPTGKPQEPAQSTPHLLRTGAIGPKKAKFRVWSTKGRSIRWPTPQRKNPSSISWLNYCWWKKSCTTWDVQNLVNNGINYLSTGAGFLPSTVYLCAIFVQFLNLNVSGILFGDSFPKPPFKVTNRRFGRYNLPRISSYSIVSSRWFRPNPSEKNMHKSNWIISPNFRDENL